MVNFTGTPSPSFESFQEALLFYSTKPNSYFSNAIANASDSATITLGPAAEYEIVIVSDAIAENPPHLIYIRNSAATIDYMMIGVPIGGTVTRRFKTKQDSLPILVRNNNSRGSILVFIAKVK